MSFLDTADAHSIAEQVRTARLSPGRVAEHFLTQASARESAIQAFVALDPQVVRKQAQGLSSPGINGLLAGVPIGVKDIIDTRDHPTGFYSRSTTTIGHRAMPMWLRCCVRRGR